MPTLDEGDVIVQLEKLPSISLEQSMAIDLRIEAALLQQVPEIQEIVARVGSDEIGMDPMGLNETDLFTVLRPEDEWQVADKAELIDRIREVIEQFPGVGYGFTQPIEMRVSEMLTGVRGDVAVKLFGPDLEVLNAKAEQIVAALESVPGAEDVFSAQNEGVHYLAIEVDRTAAGRLRLDAETLQGYLRAQLEGESIGIVQQQSRRIPLVVRGSEELRNSPLDYARMPIVLPDGRSVPLHSIANVSRQPGVVSVARERGQRFKVVRSNVTGRDLVGFVEDARKIVSERVALPAGYYLEWGGQFENQQRAAARLGLVVPIALLLVFLVLFSTFGSIRQAVLVMSNVPFALVGGVIALTLSGEYLSVPASVGFIALLGIAVLNGVVMISHFNQLYSLGHAIDEVVVEGALRRLRPVMMTASIAAFGLVPLMFASGPGSEIQRPLAIVVVGGLISATALTLVLLPILYRSYGIKGGARR
jgi:cobalt-zinc-cadmium resistance protein CzcA